MLADDTARDLWHGVNSKPARRILRELWPNVRRNRRPEAHSHGKTNKMMASTINEQIRNVVMDAVLFCDESIAAPRDGAVATALTSTPQDVLQDRRSSNPRQFLPWEQHLLARA